MSTNLHGLLVAACTALLLTPGVTSQETQGPISLTFGVYTTDKPTVMYRKFTPLVEAMEERMEQQLHTSVAIEFKIFKTYSSARTALAKGEIDFVRFGPASYVLVKKMNPKVQLLAMESKKGKKTFKGYIVVRTKSKLRKLEELRGKRFAFGDKTSTIGRYLAQKTLLDAGIRQHDLSKSDFLGRHDKVFTAVQLGNFDAGAVKSSTFHKLNKKGDLRILASFDNVTKPWVCRAGLDAKLRQAMSTALQSITDKSTLKTLKADRLISSSDEDYHIIRRSMEASVEFQTQVAKPQPKPGK